MRTLTGQDLWEFHTRGEWCAISTNGVCRTTGDAVMGAGLAKQAAERFPDLPRWLGERLRQYGNVPQAFPSIRLVTLPTKDHWRNNSNIHLIRNSIHAARQILNDHDIPCLYCPPLGCGLGGLQWHDVAQAITPWIDDRFIFVLPATVISTP